MDIAVFLTCIGFLTLISGSEGDRQIRCQILRTQKLLAANCSQRDFVQLPIVTRSGSVEVLDASGNRIRTLKNDSFVSYSSLKLLYLSDNLINFIEANAFEPLVNLEVLDLHLNSIRDIPPLLPATLWKLNLADNDVKSNLPLQNAQSLTYLSLAGNRLTSLPNTGILPQLEHLNVSDNPLEDLTIKQLSAFCQLDKLLLPPSLLSTGFPNSCNCVRVSAWIVKQSIYVDPLFNCTIHDENSCLANGSIEAQSEYAACKAAHQAYKWSESSAWVFGLAGIGCLFLLTVALTYLWRRKYSKPKPQASQPSAEEVRKRQLLKEQTSALPFVHRASFRSSKRKQRTSNQDRYSSTPRKNLPTKTAPVAHNNHRSKPPLNSVV